MFVAGCRGPGARAGCHRHSRYSPTDTVLGPRAVRACTVCVPIADVTSDDTCESDARRPCCNRTPSQALSPQGKQVARQCEHSFTLARRGFSPPATLAASDPLLGGAGAHVHT
eukprot:356565-Chlamydomonas_euryale.AAC.15